VHPAAGTDNGVEDTDMMQLTESSTAGTAQATTVVALVVYRGVLSDECHAVRSVLERAPGTHVLNVGARVDDVAGPGGVQHVDATYADVLHPDVVVLPGGLGCRELAEDVELRVWLRAVAPTCRWIVAISTGTVALAAAGVANDHPSVTHWLAGDLLTEFGGVAAAGRLRFDGNVVTCAGASVARDAAMQIVAQECGPAAVERIRAELAAAPRSGSTRRRRWGRRRCR
jgi:transcriptional regulator GlxA family with amidase domain